jgi:GNAT superfamily N-acetyltransferase
MRLADGDRRHCVSSAGHRTDEPPMAIPSRSGAHPSQRFGAPTWREAASAPVALWAAGRFAARGMRVGNAVRRQHPHDPPHWYLAMLGTHPSHQGKGLASGLLTPVLYECDAEGIPAYLESSKEANIPFYERHGFRVQHLLKVPEGCPPIWAMWRDPS